MICSEAKGYVVEWLGPCDNRKEPASAAFMYRRIVESELKRQDMIEEVHK
jgi:hypothetical protein